jgi:hypothetical protein
LAPSGIAPNTSPTTSNFCLEIAYAMPNPNGISALAVIDLPVAGSPGGGMSLVNVSVDRMRMPPLSAMRSRSSRPNSLSRMPITCGTTLPPVLPPATAFASPRNLSVGLTVGR